MRNVGECHAHLIMDGVSYREAVRLHEHAVQDHVIRERLETYKKCGITFIRDGGDALGVSGRARELASEYGIDYRTPVFALHRKGRYGAIVGLAFENLKEYHDLVRKAKSEQADFIKIMTTGILDFSTDGRVTGEPLDARMVREMVHIAHGEGMAVMCHVNGEYGVQAALEAGVDSLEHGNYMTRSCLRMLADSNTIWVPTLVTVRNLTGTGRYDDRLLEKIRDSAAENLKYAYQLGVKAACGSDAGAFGVMHGSGINEEIQAFYDILGDVEEIKNWICRGDHEIRERFRRM